MMPSLPLSALTVGETGAVVAIHAQAPIVNHLQNLGFTTGQTVQVMNATRGNLIVQMKGTRIALGVGMASRIMVEGKS